MPERPKVGIGVCIVKDRKVLLGKRKNVHGEGDWCFPGGHLEYGESWEACARRETTEEVGIKIRDVHFSIVTNDIFEKDEKHYITLYMVAVYASGEVVLREPEKCECWEWFDWSNLPSPIFLPIQNALKQGFNPFTK